MNSMAHEFSGANEIAVCMNRNSIRLERMWALQGLPSGHFLFWNK